MRGSRTLQEFAEDLGTNASNIYRYEKGRVPSGELLTALALKGINVNWLLTGEGPVHMPKAGTESASQNTPEEDDAGATWPPPEWVVKLHEEIQADPDIMQVWIALGDLLRESRSELVEGFVEKLVALFAKKRQPTPAAAETVERE